MATAKVLNSAQVSNAAGNIVTRLTVDDPSNFTPGDTVTTAGATTQIDRIQGSDLVLATQLPAVGLAVRLADVGPGTTMFRLDRTAGLVPGGVLAIGAGPNQDFVTIQSITPAGLVTLTPSSAFANTHVLNVGPRAQPLAITQEFCLAVSSGANAPAAEYSVPLSLNPLHPRYVLNAGVVASEFIDVLPPESPPQAAQLPAALATQPVASQPLANGQDDDPAALTAADYQRGLDALAKVDGVNLVVIPDAASHPQRTTIQQAAIAHCVNLADRFAILDSTPAAPPFGQGNGSVEDVVAQVRAERGFAALYYPWLIVTDPTAPGTSPRNLTIPPSGHIAGVYARTDQERGVHKAPANIGLLGALGIDQRLTDRIQGPLNLEGVNVLRVFPGDAAVKVWGARTTVDPDVTDWIYVNVRRLLLYIEQSIQQGIRWAVFEPNNQTLWRALQRTIGDFLTGIWRDGGLFGAKASDAFQVRIDDSLNPSSEIALGRLHIEILVAPVRPAEFIIVRIGLWDGGATVAES
jgi:phage tail sheath protein FI